MDVPKCTIKGGKMTQKHLSKQQSKDRSTKAVLKAFHPSLRLIQELSIWKVDSPQVKIRKFHLDEVFSPEFSTGGAGRGRECSEFDAIDIAGPSRTGDDGKMIWRLTDFICPGGQPIVEPPASFVATPISRSPVFLTTTIEFPEPPRDLVVEVFTWGPGGSSAPRIPFSWRCRVRYDEIIG